MNDRNDNNLTPDYDDHSLAALLEEYSKLSASEQTAWLNAPIGEPVPEKPKKAPAPQSAKPADAAPEEIPAEAAPEESPEEIARREREAAIASLENSIRLQRQAAEKQPRKESPSAAEGDAREASVPVDDSPEPAAFRRRRSVAELLDEEDEPAPAEAPEEKLSFADRFLTPVVRLIATKLAQRQMQNAEAANWPEPVDIRETPELTPSKAGKFYTALLRPLRLRLRIALFLCIILAWISMRLPMFGGLAASLRLQAGVCLVVTLAVTVTALDVFAAGLRQLADLRPGAESLAALAVIFSCVDGVMVLAGKGDSLPFCAIGAFALTAALWGERLTCSALRRTFKVTASSKTPSVLASESSEGEDSAKNLVRDERTSTEGIVRRSESQDLCQTVYAAAAPFLLGAALLLSVAASLGGRGHFLHTLSALISVSASFAAFFSFPLPWAIATRKLKNSGVALAGYAGCADIGKTRRVVITDEDLFPAGTLKFSEINIQEGVFPAKVVTYTASLIEASGSGVASLFADLVKRRDYRIPRAEDFVAHEGGGLSGLIHGEKVLVGSAGFMNLMGIRLPMNLQSKNAICTAIGGELEGVFAIDYIPVTSVQEALVTLLRGKTQAIFAIRDFNITPRMISQLFRMPTDSFTFPPFRDRYRLGSTGSDETAPVNAVVTRSGMLPLVEAAETGRKAYGTCRINTVLSLVGTVIGMVIMFLLCRAGSFDTASAGNVLSFMLLWALPAVFLSVGLNRQ